MPSKRVRTLIRATPAENKTQSQNGVNDRSNETSDEPTQSTSDDDLVYDSDQETSSATGTTAPIAMAN